MGLAKNMSFFGIAAMAANIRKAASFLVRFGLAEPQATG
jgi:IS5 family transposase